MLYVYNLLVKLTYRFFYSGKHCNLYISSIKQKKIEIYHFSIQVFSRKSYKLKMLSICSMHFLAFKIRISTKQNGINIIFKGTLNFPFSLEISEKKIHFILRQSFPTYFNYENKQQQRIERDHEKNKDSCKFSSCSCQCQLGQILQTFPFLVLHKNCHVKSDSINRESGILKSQIITVCNSFVTETLNPKKDLADVNQQKSTTTMASEI